MPFLYRGKKKNFSVERREERVEDIGVEEWNSEMTSIVESEQRVISRDDAE